MSSKDSGDDDCGRQKEIEIDFKATQFRRTFTFAAIEIAQLKLNLNVLRTVDIERNKFPIASGSLFVSNGSEACD